MNALTRIQVQLRAAVHRRVGTLPAWARGRVSGLSGPSRLDLELDDLDAEPVVLGGSSARGQAAATAPDARHLAEWRGRALDVFIAHGVLPVTVVARPENPVLGEIVRFCHRLEAPVTVRTLGAGLDERAAAAIIDGGARRVVVHAPTLAAMQALGAVRASRRAKVDIEAALPPGASVQLAKELMAAGADGVRVEPPWRNPAPGPWPLRSAPGSFNRTQPSIWRALDALAGASVPGERPGDVVGPPGHARDGGRCAIGGRLALDAEGVRSCPWKDGGMGRDGQWADLEGHRAAIASCHRACWHFEAR